ncbi:hypothetical protein ElyMa_005404100 [Elysia marginata]|uniref:Uncharacterized protein n=1 Tax=Elysia marginata TaxID=1093978 RepID=A0AAV4EHI2_9GAST|nr:hypothetical protein ElyMa_005404100 [Elysia marginata]
MFKAVLLVIAAALPPTLVECTATEACKNLTKCIEDVINGTSGTMSYLYLTSKPATNASWTSTWSEICSTKSTRTQCTYNSTCTNSQTLNRARAARKKALAMCTDDGKKFFRRMYTHPDSCLGNFTKIKEIYNNNLRCKENGTKTITSEMTTQQKCQ